jgi:hypothetical protein
MIVKKIIAILTDPLQLLTIDLPYCRNIAPKRPHYGRLFGERVGKGEGRDSSNLEMRGLSCIGSPPHFYLKDVLSFAEIRVET